MDTRFKTAISETDSALIWDGLDRIEPGIAVFDTEMHVVFANRRYRETHDGQAPDRRSGGGLDPRRSERTLSDGRMLEISLYPLAGGGFITLETDITERKSVESAIREREQNQESTVVELRAARRQFEGQAAEMAGLAEALAEEKERTEAALRSKSNFVAALGHEFRTPLTAIIGFSHLVQSGFDKGVDREDMNDRINCILEAGEHLLDLVNDMLDISKIEAGKHELCEAAFPISRAIEPAVRMVIQKAGDCGVAITQEVDRAWPDLFADQRMIRQILVNLLSNAIKFTPRGGRVALKAWCRPDEGYFLEVADTGIGMTPEDIPKALSVFGQIDSEQGRNHQGTGLGLPLARSLVELHGGSFDLRSAEGAGTTITLCFPPDRIVRAQKGKAKQKR